MAAELFAAIENHDVTRLAQLLGSGVDANAARAEWPRFTALQAVINELEDGLPLQALELLLAHHANVNAWDEGHDSTPLLMAVLRGQFEAVALLLKAGGDPNVRGSEGDTPLGWSVEQDELPTAKLLLDHGAAATIDDISGARGMTPLGMASSKLNLPMVELLLAAGANPQATDEGMLIPFERLPPRARTNAKIWNQIAEALGH